MRGQLLLVMQRVPRTNLLLLLLVAIQLAHLVLGIPLPFCNPDPCKNGGTCQVLAEEFTYVCDCPQGFAGQNCTLTDDCVSAPCAHGATCVNGVGSFTCTCQGGFTGALCQTEIDECASAPCMHGGTCVDAIGQFACICAAGWNGTLCQKQEQAVAGGCDPNPCANCGTCTEDGGYAICQCPSGVSGDRCQSVTGDYQSQPCRGNGTSSQTDWTMQGVVIGFGSSVLIVGVVVVVVFMVTQSASL